MKKFFIVAIVALVCLGLTMPALAKVKVGGMITQDVLYYSANDSRVRSSQTGGTGVPAFPTAAVNPDSSFSATDFRLPRPLNRVNVAYSNDDNTIRGFIEIRGGNNPDTMDAIGGFDTFNWNYGYIDWVLSPNDFLRFGRQTQSFSIRAPSQMLGWNRGHLIGNNYGNISGGTARDGVRWYHDFNDTVKLRIGLYDPDTDGGEAIKGFSAQVFGGATANVLEENVIPRIDIALPLNFGSFRLWPSVTYLSQKYDQGAPGTEDSVDIWGICLAGQVKFGPVTFDAEVNVGENLGVGNYVGGAGATPAAWNSGATAVGNDSINDAKMTSWWLDVGWKVGPATIHGIVGSMKVKREDDPTAASTNVDWSRWMYGISVPIAVAKGFTIRPELMGYDLDTDATVGNTSTVDYGKEYILGVQFQLVF